MADPFHFECDKNKRCNFSTASYRLRLGSRNSQSRILRPNAEAVSISVLAGRCARLENVLQASFIISMWNAEQTIFRALKMPVVHTNSPGNRALVSLEMFFQHFARWPSVAPHIPPTATAVHFMRSRMHVSNTIVVGWSIPMFCDVFAQESFVLCFVQHSCGSSDVITKKKNASPIANILGNVVCQSKNNIKIASKQRQLKNWNECSLHEVQ